MNTSTTVEWLSKAIAKATRSAKFCVSGCLPATDPSIEIEHLGVMKLPLKRATAKELIAHCHLAPFGKGTQTLVNTKVRKTFELDPRQFRLSDEWDSAIARTTRLVAVQLGLPAEQLEAKLYKLLVYEKGGFFLPHRDSEKRDRMVASLIVVLPNAFQGGALIVRHGAAEQTFAFDEAATGTLPCYVAFYADCEHEVQRVTHGVRLCLAYNLVLKPNRKQPSTIASPADPVDLLAASIGSWIALHPAEPLVFALEHHYTERGLSLDLLKGADRPLADVLVSAAEKAECCLNVAQVSRHLLQFADDGSFSQWERRSSYYGRPSRRTMEIGETYEDELHGTQWTSVVGKKQPWGDIAFDVSAIVSSVPIDDWKPTSEEFEGYTGNAGNTLDRWYHRSAMVVWHREHHFDVVASGGPDESISLFCSMAARLAKTPKKRLEAARTDCLRFARAITAKWPRSARGYGHFSAPDKSLVDAFLEHLLLLHDRDTIAALLTKVAEQDQTVRLSSFIAEVCGEFGWTAFALELKQLLTSRTNARGGQELPFRDGEWLSTYCCNKSVDPDKSALARELCRLAVERFCEPRPPRPAYYRSSDRREVSVSETSLPLLLKAIVASGSDDALSRVVGFVQSAPNDFSLDDCQVPCLKTVIPWSQKHFGTVQPPLAHWLDAVRRQLESATSQPPIPPTDWTRPADVACTCRFCAQLNAFLANPVNEIGRIPAREDMRQHLIGMIQRHRCDVKHALERKGSPFSLVLTKTTGSFERAVKRFQADLKLLDALPPGE